MEPKTDKLAADLDAGAMVVCARHFLSEVHAQCAAYSPSIGSPSITDDPHMSDAEKCQRLTDLLNEPHPTSATTRAVARCFFVHAYVTRIGAELDHTHGITARYVESAISYLEQSFMGESDAEQEQRDQMCSGAAANLLYKAAQDSGEFLNQIVDLIGRSKIESVEQTRRFLEEMSQHVRPSVSSANSNEARVESVCDFAQQVLAKTRTSYEEIRSENERLGAEIADSFDELHKKLTDEVIELRRREESRSADDNVVTNYLVTEEIIRLIKRVQDECERFLRKTSESEYAKLDEVESQVKSLGDQLVNKYDLPNDARFAEFGFTQKGDEVLEKEPFVNETTPAEAEFKIPTSPPQRRRKLAGAESAMSPRTSSGLRRSRGSHKRTPSGALLEKMAQFQGTPNSEDTAADSKPADSLAPPPPKRGRHHRRASSKLVFETALLFESYSQASTPTPSKPCTPRVDSWTANKAVSRQAGSANSSKTKPDSSMSDVDSCKANKTTSRQAGSINSSKTKPLDTNSTEKSIATKSDSTAAGDSPMAIDSDSSMSDVESKEAVASALSATSESHPTYKLDADSNMDCSTLSTSTDSESEDAPMNSDAPSHVAPSVLAPLDEAPSETKESTDTILQHSSMNIDSESTSKDVPNDMSESKSALESVTASVDESAVKDSLKSELISKAKKSAPTDKSISSQRNMDDITRNLKSEAKTRPPSSSVNGVKRKSQTTAPPPVRTGPPPSVLAKGLIEANTTVLLIGAQHAGKSTLISHLFGVRHKNIPSLTSGEHTKNAHLYSCKFADLKLHVIDTPGVAFDPIDEYAAQDFYNREIRQCNKVDLIVWVIDVEASYNLLQNSLRNWIKVLKHHKSQRFLKEKLVVVLAKTDRLASWAGPKASSGAQKYREFADEVRSIKQKVRHELKYMLQAGSDPKKQREIDGIPICVSGRAAEDPNDEPFGSNPWTTRIWSEFSKRIDSVDAENFEKCLKQFEYRGRNPSSPKASPLSLYGDDLVQVTHWTEAPDHTSFQRFFRRISSNATP